MARTCYKHQKRVPVVIWLGTYLSLDFQDLQIVNALQTEQMLFGVKLLQEVGILLGRRVCGMPTSGHLSLVGPEMAPVVSDLVGVGPRLHVQLESALALREKKYFSVKYSTGIHVDASFQQNDHGQMIFIGAQIDIKNVLVLIKLCFQKQ